MTITGKVEWDGTPGEWWGTVTFTLHNKGSVDLVDPLIEFVVHTRQSIAKNSCLEPTRPAGSNKVTGRLEDWCNTIPAGQTGSFTIGVGPADGQPGVGPLPTKLTVNGVPVDPDDPPPPPDGPTTPGNFRITSTAQTGLTVAWDASTSPAGIDRYELSWSTEGGQPDGTSVPADTLSYTAVGLQPGTHYRLAVYAVDGHGKASKVATTGGSTDPDGPPPPPGSWGVPSAPFLDLCRYPSPTIADYTAAGVRGLFLGFAVAGKHASVHGRLTWGGNTTMYDSVSGQESSGVVAESEYKRAEIAAMRAAGLTPILSIGGAAGGPIEQVVTDVAAIVAEYEAVLDRYGLTHLDFDFEGGVEHDEPAMARHRQAMAILVSRRPGLRYSYTLSVNLWGFNAGGRKLVGDLAHAGLKPHAIQGMLMEMGETSTVDRWDVARRTTEAMVAHIRQAGFGWTDAELWSRVGLCPMYGRNNDGTRFTLDHMRSLVAYARQKGVAVVSGWDASRDHNQWRIPACCTNEGSDNGLCTYVPQQPLDFSRTAATYTGRQRQEQGPEPVPPPRADEAVAAAVPVAAEQGCCRRPWVDVMVDVTVNGEPAGGV